MPAGLRPPTSTHHLVVRGAREHNLKDVSLDLPRDSLDRLHRPVRLRQVLAWRSTRSSPRASAATSSRCRPTPGSSSARWTSPTSTSSRACRPAVSIDQKSTNRNPRSTVGTITEVYDYLRLLFARAGRPHCPVCGEPITRQTPAADRRPGARAARGHPLPGARAGRARPQGRVRRPVRRAADQGLLPRPGRRRGRLADRAAQAGEAGEAHHRGGRRPARRQGRRRRGQAAADRLGRDRARPGRRACSSSTSSTCDAEDPDRERRFSEKMACPNDHPLDIDELEPRSFSFNSPFGACPECTGLGTELEVDPELLVPDEDLTLARGRDRAVGPGARVGRLLPAADRRPGRGPRVLPRHAVAARCRSAPRRRCCTGRTTRSTSATATATAASAPTPPASRASCPSSSAGTPRPSPTGAASATRATCARCRAPTCEGARLKPESLAVLVGGQNIAEVCALPIGDCAELPRRRRPHRPRAADRRAGAQGDQRPARLPARRRPRLPLPRPARRHAVRRRGPAHPAGHPDRLRPGRRPLRARRAVASACTSATTTG